MSGVAERCRAILGDHRIARILCILWLLGSASSVQAAEESLPVGALSFTPSELEEWSLERARAHDFPDIECTFCHSNEGLRLKLRTPDGRVRDFYVDPELSKRSIHYQEGMELCTDCHDDSCMTCDDPSHVIDCFECHDEEDTEQAQARDSVARSVHADFMRGQCAACHNPHYMKAAADMTLAEKDQGCLGCHEDQSRGRLDPLVLRHEWHPQASLHLARIACIACHTTPDASEPASFKHAILASAEAVRECTECHSPDGRLQSYLEDIGEDAKSYLTPEGMLANFYITGVTHNRTVERVGMAVIALTCIGTLGHGVLRAVMRRKR